MPKNIRSAIGRFFFAFDASFSIIELPMRDPEHPNPAFAFQIGSCTERRRARVLRHWAMELAAGGSPAEGSSSGGKVHEWPSGGVGIRQRGRRGCSAGPSRRLRPSRHADGSSAPHSARDCFAGSDLERCPKTRQALRLACGRAIVSKGLEFISTPNSQLPTPDSQRPTPNAQGKHLTARRRLLWKLDVEPPHAPRYSQLRVISIRLPCGPRATPSRACGCRRWR